MASRMASWEAAKGLWQLGAQSLACINKRSGRAGEVQRDRRCAGKSFVDPMSGMEGIPASGAISGVRWITECSVAPTRRQTVIRSS